jgi:glycerol-3-phosphate dehydrogenase (NAD(P)+)
VSRLLVVGAGSWGTALAIALAPKFEKVMLLARDAGQASRCESSRENVHYLPGFSLPANISVVSDPAAALSGARIVLSAIPSRHLRETYCDFAPYLTPAMSFVSATKGIEMGTLLRMSQVIENVVSARFQPRVAALSGPTFAKEIAAGEPAAVVIASSDPELASQIQNAFSSPSLRFYTSHDIIGVEIGAALKNVIAIGAGICQGLGLGGNSVAALVTRGLAELTRLAVALGGKPKTLSGLAGLGDLVLTSTGDLSRNRYVGIQLGSGRGLNDILHEMTQVAEGVDTCKAAHELALRNGVHMPISEKMFEILYEGKPAAVAIRELMERPLTSE